MELDLTSLEKAVASLDEVLRQEKTVFIRDAAIQRFEYTYELCWKFIKRWLETESSYTGVDRLGIKDLYRKGAEAGLISNTLEWFDFHKARNETAHTYNEGKAEEVYTEAGKFLIRAKELLAELRLRKDAKP